MEAAQGLRADLLHRHRKDAPRATQAWDSLVAKASMLESDTSHGQAIPRDRWPKQFSAAGYPNLYRLELAHAFRALYSVVFDPDRHCHVIAVDWIGSHEEYDRLFGYHTS